MYKISKSHSLPIFIRYKLTPFKFDDKHWTHWSALKHWTSLDRLKMTFSCWYLCESTLETSRNVEKHKKNDYGMEPRHTIPRQTKPRLVWNLDKYGTSTTVTPTHLSSTSFTSTNFISTNSIIKKLFCPVSFNNNFSILAILPEW